MKREIKNEEIILRKLFTLPEVARDYIRICVEPHDWVSTIEHLYEDFHTKVIEETLN